MSSAAERDEVEKKYDYYHLLGLPATADEADIRKAYRRAALKYHPDKNKSRDAVQVFHALAIASEVLLNGELRKEYDNKRAAKEQLKQRQAQFDVKRRRDKDDLERREREAAQARRGGTTGGILSQPRPEGWDAGDEERLLEALRRCQAQSAMLREQRDTRLRNAREARV
ncbi:DnaJ domain-containing protein [Limtongia smithiae]|uniref:DnaJ domain-containing protein n=1 Tax=Limtongia smithiae TaxID=1125753 RepID=UPI0034CF13E9